MNRARSRLILRQITAASPEARTAAAVNGPVLGAYPRRHEHHACKPYESKVPPPGPTGDPVGQFSTEGTGDEQSDGILQHRLEYGRCDQCIEDPSEKPSYGNA